MTVTSPKDYNWRLIVAFSCGGARVARNFLGVVIAKVGDVGMFDPFAK